MKIKSILDKKGKNIDEKEILNEFHLADLMNIITHLRNKTKDNIGFLQQISKLYDSINNAKNDTIKIQEVANLIEDVDQFNLKLLNLLTL